ncbi:iron-sulfur cluster carrier protein ApbC [uncultured Cohaesibacter sp.]|uniref:iron-sulfur cluster carrier protein ApbC n=1 Tax=uncultured Cohaesibacter sp. TaxID=1002546 RepID=UPI002930D8AD|nr:iron-sulfur cluster carrier protein ApbC [uncultured Cohaesibacter sp.]
MTQDKILELLKQYKVSPEAPDLVSSGRLSEIIVNDGTITFSITIPAKQAAAYEELCKLLEEKIEALEGVEKAMIVLTAEREPSQSQGEAARNAAPQAQRARQTPPKSQGPAKIEISGVRNIIAVSSAKGGVGKSTTAVNLALALQANGQRVGILDADIYGPSIPRLLNINEQPTVVPNTRIMNPIEAYGLVAMSIGLLVEQDTPMVWRGPIAVSALTQMIRDVAWATKGELDTLVVDMPPGTGDIQLTMAQQVPLSGSVIVSTPQDLALIDARKGIEMFRKVNIPILGIVENMSYFSCPTCGTRHDIFGHGGARETARKINVPFLGEIPLHMDIRERSDLGQPIVISDPESDHAMIYRNIAEGMVKQMAGAMKPAPKIMFEE